MHFSACESLPSKLLAFPLFVKRLESDLPHGIVKARWQSAVRALSWRRPFRFSSAIEAAAFSYTVQPESTLIELFWAGANYSLLEGLKLTLLSVAVLLDAEFEWYWMLYSIFNVVYYWTQILWEHRYIFSGKTNIRISSKALFFLLQLQFD